MNVIPMTVMKLFPVTRSMVMRGLVVVYFVTRQMLSGSFGTESKILTVVSVYFGRWRLSTWSQW